MSEEYKIIEVPLDVPTTSTGRMEELAEMVENNTGEYAVDLRENEIISNWRKNLITASEAEDQLSDLILLQTEERWQGYLQEYQDKPETIQFMEMYGYVPFSFEIEEWREDDEYPFDDEQKQHFIKEGF